jgi:hypothetical protein
MDKVTGSDGKGDFCRDRGRGPWGSLLPPCRFIAPPFGVHCYQLCGIGRRSVGGWWLEFLVLASGTGGAGAERLRKCVEEVATRSLRGLTMGSEPFINRYKHVLVIGSAADRVAVDAGWELLRAHSSRMIANSCGVPCVAHRCERQSAYGGSYRRDSFGEGLPRRLPGWEHSRDAGSRGARLQSGGYRGRDRTEIPQPGTFRCLSGDRLLPKVQNRTRGIPEKREEEDALLAGHSEWSPTGLREGLIARRKTR